MAGWPSRRSKTQKQVLIEHGVDSGLELDIQNDLKARGIDVEREPIKLTYVVPASNHKYTPDFRLPNGIIIESKGRWLPADRKKMGLIKAQHPDLDIRMVFTRSRTPISKGSKTTYGDWCDKLGIPYADKRVPDDWLN